MEEKRTEEAALPPIDIEGLAATNTGAETRPVSDAWIPPPPAQDSWDSGYQPGDMPKQRPTGVTVIAIVNFVGAFLIGLIYIFALGSGQDMGIAAIILPVDVVFAIAVGIGLLQLKNWARYLAFVGYGINIVIDIFGMLTGPVEGSTLLNLAIAGIIIWYLRQPQVAEAFE